MAIKITNNAGFGELNPMYANGEIEATREEYDGYTLGNMYYADTYSAHGKFFKRLGHMFAHLNPVMAGIRGGMLAAMKKNVHGMATKIYPGIVTDVEAIRAGYDPAYIKTGRDRYNKVRDKFVKMGGDVSNLNRAIKGSAANKAIPLKAIVHQEGLIAGKPLTNRPTADGNYNGDGDGDWITMAISAIVSIFGSSQNEKVMADPNKNASLHKDSGTLPNEQQTMELQKQAIMNNPNLTQEQKQQAIAAIDGNEKTGTNYTPYIIGSVALVVVIVIVAVLMSCKKANVKKI